MVADRLINPWRTYLRKNVATSKCCLHKKQRRDPNDALDRQTDSPKPTEFHHTVFYYPACAIDRTDEHGLGRVCLECLDRRKESEQNRASNTTIDFTPPRQTKIIHATFYFVDPSADLNKHSHVSYYMCVRLKLSRINQSPPRRKMRCATKIENTQK